MAVDVTTRHMELPEDTRVFTREKAEEIEALFPRVESIHVVLDQERFLYRAGVTVQGKNHLRLEATEQADDLRAAVDSAMDKIEKQLRRHRDKVQDRRDKVNAARFEQEIAND